MDWFDLKFIISVLIGLAGLISNFYFHLEDENDEKNNKHRNERQD